ncbi:hypothetical protein EDB83DRAFT_2676708 [Lactarius deliciosus]|nr:hypothetical protein EDB83DRAFT_2676708 [Lactarius deliciosus]
MAVHPRVSAVHDDTDAAFDDAELDEDVEVVFEADGDEDEDEDGAAVEAKETVTLSSAQNCWARFSAEGTFVLQLPATQVYSASGNILSQRRVSSWKWRDQRGHIYREGQVAVDGGDAGAVRLCDRKQVFCCWKEFLRLVFPRASRYAEGTRDPVGILALLPSPPSSERYRDKRVDFVHSVELVDGNPDDGGQLLAYTKTSDST